MPKLADWLVLKNDCADLMDPSSVGSRSGRSVIN